jgi:thiol-disulfide isomerase/thioredoxin
MTKKIVISLGVLFAVVFGVLYGKGLLRVHEGLTPPASLAVLEAQKPAKPAPAVTFFDAAGGRHALADFKGRYVLLNMWATWCGPCVAELPALARLKKAVPGLAVLAVDVGRDKPEVADAFLKSHKAAGLGTLVDSEITLSRQFGAAVYPTTVLIDPAGKVVARAEGPASWDAADAIDYFKRLAGS